MVGVINWKVHRCSSSASINLCVADANGLSLEIGWESGKCTKVTGAVMGLATG